MINSEQGYACKITIQSYGVTQFIELSNEYDMNLEPVVAAMRDLLLGFGFDKSRVAEFITIEEPINEYRREG